MAPRDLALLFHNRVFFGLSILSLVLITGALGYMVIEGWSFLDALYMSAITITTVGYREVEPLSTTGQIFTMALLFVGVGVAFYILTAMVAVIIEGDLGLAFGARRMKAAVARMDDHYIVCGFGRVGDEIAHEFKERGVSFVVVDRSEEALARARTGGFNVVAGDATIEAVLQEAGIERCRALIAATDSDASNIYITLTASSMRDDVFVVARVSSLSVESKLRQAGASRIISPYAIGGRRLAFAALQPAMADFFNFESADKDEDRILAEFVIDEASHLSGKDLGQVFASCRDAVVLAVRDPEGKLIVGPPSSRRVSIGEKLIVVGAEDDLRTVGIVP